MFKVGITGGIGSGKSTVAKLFQLLGVPVYYADEEAKKLMNTHEAIKEQLLKAFGKETYNEVGLNRIYLASQVFNQPDKLQLLNSIVHPVVIDEAEAWMERQTSAYTLKEAALFFESGSVASVDFMIGVWAPQPLRIQRVMHRDGIDRQAVLDRMNKQIDETIKMRLCDTVIVNDEQQMVIPQVIALHEKLLETARGKG